MSRYLNYLLFFLVVILFISFNIDKKISTDLNSVLPPSKEKKLIDQFLKFEINKKIFLAVKGSDKKSLNRISNFEKQILEIKGITKDKKFQSRDLQQFINAYKFYLNDIDSNKLETLNEKKELEKIYRNLIDSFFSFYLDKEDPLNLLIENKKNINSNIIFKNGHLFLKDYGYFTVFNIDNDINSLAEYNTIYDEISFIVKNDTQTKIFSSLFYFVENSTYIKEDVSRIVLFATIFLLIIYSFVLRNLKLLINGVITLLSSGLFATFVLLLFYEKISIFVIVFGFSISSISIDYMFHHYFHNYYREYNKLFNKEVFLGFMTTFIAFVILSFTDFFLIKQIAFFAMLSLLFSYLSFSFLYPRLSFKLIDVFISFKNNKPFLDSKYLFLISIVLIVVTLFSFSFDFDIKNLDYDNKKLKKVETFFTDKLKEKKIEIILLEAKSIDKLIEYNEIIRSIDESSVSSLDSLISQKRYEQKNRELSLIDFEKIKKNLQLHSHEFGFKKNSFKNSYNVLQEKPIYTYDKLLSYGIAVNKNKNSFFSYVFISPSKIDEVLKNSFASSANLKLVFQQHLKNSLNQLFLLGLIVILFIFIMLLATSKNKKIYSLSFLVFPTSMIFLYFSFVKINILHIFTFFIMLAIFIDYAIYSSKSLDNNTKKSIVFSALTSFTGFGVLIFSNINALSSIGFVSTIGLSAIIILIFFQKVTNAS